MSNDDVVVDETLESRSMLVYGVESMKKMKAANVLISGMSGVGIEIAKNVALAGVKTLALHDARPVTNFDLASQFYLTEADLGKNRATISAPKVAELNAAVKVKALTNDWSESGKDEDDFDFLDTYTCVVFTEGPSLSFLIRANAYCRQRGIRFIYADVRGVFSWCFVDNGDSFVVTDTNGEEPVEVLVGDVQVLKGAVAATDGALVLRVATLKEARHPFEAQQWCVFREVEGMTALNDQEFEIVNTSAFAFDIKVPADMAKSISAQTYERCGITKQVKKPKTLTFKSLEESLKTPDFEFADWGKMEHVQQVHLALQGLLSLPESSVGVEDTNNEGGQRSFYPKPWCAAGAQKLREACEAVNKERKLVEKVNSTIVNALAFTARATFTPLCAFVGGVVAQEVLKSLSGKFSPLKQWLLVDAVEVLPHWRAVCNASQDGDAEDNGDGDKAVTSKNNEATDKRVVDMLKEAEAYDCPQDDFSICEPQGSRYDSLIVCLGKPLSDRLRGVRIFMIGCGAIGCEMLKNFAMLGIATDKDKDNAKIVVTDPDLIEKSNLNRQFLFRNADIGHPKSERATRAVLGMNPELTVDVALDRVGAETETKYDDAFFQATDVVVNALDNVAARLYVDSRCVTNQKPLLESGTLGPKGHVQVIVPFLTESYASQRDPPEKDVPFCTLKSFPSKLEHCAEWARDFAFGDFFVSKAEMWNSLFAEDGLEAKLACLGETEEDVDDDKDNGKAKAEDDKAVGMRHVIGGGIDPKLIQTTAEMLALRPSSVEDCIEFAREIFDEYYRKAAMQLLHNFPLDHTIDEQGTLFWSPPKRPPKVIEFDFEHEEWHRQFIIRFTALWAKVWGIDFQFDPEGSDGKNGWTTAKIGKVASSASVKPFVAKKVKIVTDEKAKAEDAAEEDENDEENGENYDEILREACKNVLAFVQESKANQKEKAAGIPTLDVAKFEKDDDSNHHIDFIAATANLRARMYGIPEGDRLKVKGIAGRIMPAIATTTAAVSGLVGLELVKIVRRSPLEHYKNLFMNLALPFFTFSEPHGAEKTKVTDEVYTTLWDSWEVRGAETLKDLIKYFDERFDLKVNGVAYGAAMVYMSFMPTHKKRKAKSLRELCKETDPSVTYVDLTLTFRDGKGKDVNGPAVRVHFVH